MARVVLSFYAWNVGLHAYARYLDCKTASIYSTTSEICAKPSGSDKEALMETYN